MNPSCLNNRRLVGARINELRRMQGLSLRKLASMVNMDYAYICNIESGQANPTLDSLSKIADGLDVEVVALFESGSDTDYSFSTME
ncbi:MAG: helix-turn-helix transcriptional regulator [Coriobacteriales bacterium]